MEQSKRPAHHEPLGRGQPMRRAPSFGRYRPLYKSHRCILRILQHCFLSLHLLYSCHKCAMVISMPSEIPSSILIVGSGAFGLSTAYALCRNSRYKNTSITVVDRQAFPTPDGSSVSTSHSAWPNILTINFLILSSHTFNDMHDT